MTHHSHPRIIKRLKRADGHLRMIITMIEEGRLCIELVQQLQAVESAIDNAKKALIHDHIDHCLDRSIRVSGPNPTFSTGASEGVRGPAKRRFGWKGLHYIRGAGPAMWLAAVMRGGGCGGNIRLS